jgi:VanZ family protein
MPSRVFVSRAFAAAFVLAAAAVVWLSLAPVTAGPVARHVDKVEHFLAYAGLTLLGFAARGRAWPLMAGGIVVFGGGVEVLQALMPMGRMGSVLDGLANAAGVGAAWAGWAAVERRRRR